MGVLGDVFTDKVIVQRLTEMMWFGQSSTEEDARAYRVVQVFKALRQCIIQLEAFYKDLDANTSSFDSAQIDPTRFCPYPTSFTTNSGQVRFKYIRMMEENAACVTYQSKISDPVDSPNIVVKSVSRYGTKVHKFLADHNHSPKPLYCDPTVWQQCCGR